MYVVDRLEFAAGLADLAQELVVRALADQRLLDRTGADWRRAHTAERDGRAGDLAGAILDQQRRRRHDREIAMAASELDEAMAVRLRPKRKPHHGDELIQLDRGGHIGDREGVNRDFAGAARPLHRDRGIERGRDRDELGRWVEMAERAAERAAVAGLAMADLQDRLVHQWAALANKIGEFELALTRHRADLERAVALADEGEPLDPIEIDDVIGQHEPHVQHGHQRLPAGEKLGVLEPAKQRDSITNRARVVVAEGRRFHAVGPWQAPGRPDLLYRTNRASIQKRRKVPNMRHGKISPLSFRGAARRRTPESTLLRTRSKMDSGFAPSVRPGMTAVVIAR